MHSVQGSCIEQWCRAQGWESADLMLKLSFISAAGLTVFRESQKAEASSPIDQDRFMEGYLETFQDAFKDQLVALNSKRMDPKMLALCLQTSASSISPAYRNAFLRNWGIKRRKMCLTYMHTVHCSLKISSVHLHWHLWLYIRHYKQNLILFIELNTELWTSVQQRALVSRRVSAPQ